LIGTGAPELGRPAASALRWPQRGPRRLRQRRQIQRASTGLYVGPVLWDGLSAYWSTKMRAWLDSQRDWLTVERLPAYAPELNAVE
jgi:transposase